MTAQLLKRSKTVRQSNFVYVDLPSTKLENEKDKSSVLLTFSASKLVFPH